MIQRVQSLYLLASAAMGAVCLFRPAGRFLTAEGERRATLFNLWLRLADGSRLYAPWVLFAILAIACALTLTSVFLYKFRALQMRVVSLCMILLTGYYICLALFAWLHAGGGSFRPTVAAALPFVCIVLLYLAFRGILKDETLIRSLDRLR